MEWLKKNRADIISFIRHALFVLIAGYFIYNWLLINGGIREKLLDALVSFIMITVFGIFLGVNPNPRSWFEDKKSESPTEG